MCPISIRLKLKVRLTITVNKLVMEACSRWSHLTSHELYYCSLHFTLGAVLLLLSFNPRKSEGDMYALH